MRVSRPMPVNSGGTSVEDSRGGTIISKLSGSMPAGIQVPVGWRIVQLADVADVAFSPVDKKSIDGEMPVWLCNYTDVFYNRHIVPEMDFMAATATEVEYAKWGLREGDVIFTKDSETREEIGVPSYVSETLPDVLCGYHLALARPRPNCVDGAFLSEMLASRVSAKQFSRIANGVTRFGLTLDATRSLPILLPPLSEQRAIAAILNSIDDAIERTEAVIAATESMRDSLLHELLTCGVSGWHSEWKEVRGLGAIPSDWEVVRLGDVADVAFSPVDKKSIDGEMPVWLCNYTDVFYNRHIVPEMDFMAATATEAEYAKWGLREGDVIFTKDSETREEIGVPSYVSETLPDVLCGYHLALARPRPNCVDGAFLSEMLASRVSAKQFSRIANGVTRFGLTLGATRSLQILLPPLTEQRAIAALLGSIDEATERAKTKKDALVSLKVSTADALLTGRVRVLRSEG